MKLREQIASAASELAAFEAANDVSEAAEAAEIAAAEHLLGPEADVVSARTIHRGMVRRLAELRQQLVAAELAAAEEAERAAEAERLRLAAEADARALRAWRERISALPEYLCGDTWKMVEGKPVSGEDSLASIMDASEIARLRSVIERIDALGGYGSRSRRATRRVRNQLGLGVGIPPIEEEEGEWTPSSYTEVARRVGASTFVEALTVELARLSKEAQAPRPMPPRPPPARRWFK